MRLKFSLKSVTLRMLTWVLQYLTERACRARFQTPATRCRPKYRRLTASSSWLHMNLVFTSPPGQELETWVVVQQDVELQLVNNSGPIPDSRDQTGQPTSSLPSTQPSFAVRSSLTRITSCCPISTPPIPTPTISSGHSAHQPALPPLSLRSVRCESRKGRDGDESDLISAASHVLL